MKIFQYLRLVLEHNTSMTLSNISIVNLQFSHVATHFITLHGILMKPILQIVVAGPLYLDNLTETLGFKMTEQFFELQVLHQIIYIILYLWPRERQN